MRARVLRPGCVFVALAALASAGAAHAHDAEAHATARASAVRIVIPGGGESAGAVSAPPATSALLDGYSYGDGIVTTGAIVTNARAESGAEARGVASARVQQVSIFGGEITIGSLTARATARASAAQLGGSLSGSAVADVRVLGQPVDAQPNTQVPLGDWGYAVLLEQAVVPESGSRRGRRGFVSALHVHLTADHGGLPAGSDITIGYAEASARTAKSAQPITPTTTGPIPNPPPAAPPAGPARDPKPQPPGATPEPPPVVQQPPAGVKPSLTANGYVFPVYGAASFTDDFAAARAEVGWHHGNDIFAPLGAPVLAVADGTLFLVGWNRIGGQRLWLRDDQGNEFYYAHLSAFSPLAFDGSRVRAGDVLGFVGATGDAVGTPPHLHFEIHPAGLLGLGYDGVINPYEYLLAWRRLDDAAFDAGRAAPGEAPPPAAVLLQAEDISTVSGLDPEALSQMLETPALFGEGL